MIISEIRRSLDNECFYAALSLALTLPDVCGKAEYGEIGTGNRYKKWCKRFVCAQENTDDPYSVDMPYLSEEILYSLRNALLHQATVDIDVDDIHEERCKVDEFTLIITERNSYDSGTSSVSYGKNLEIVGRTQEISIKHICYVICNATEKYYCENTQKFNFIRYKVVDKRSE